ncbi:exodeoxyribonuclease 1 [Moniliophthora roreri MCA 2997]|uniref:Exodeoxyribonuclease 1 n=1 Tax=Moniliophthora roreri (strain MCA 2997) TaxID=1381753 RepID=V2X3H6_MONRO|nr:exodeoxyribonuclease 1 [Moniliophthora roreri MCA 2997]
MGISGLLPALKSIQVTKHLSEYSGQTIAVDAYVWLHKGVYACATELATHKPTIKYVNYAMERVRLLRHHGIEPYIIFDGGPLPAKQGTEIERKKKREENIARGHALASQGKHSQAREYYTKCVDVTPQMAFQFIKALRAEGVKYIVAPYEADAQLAFLEKLGLVSAILTEDSDLLVFGCKNVLFKLDTVARTVVSISIDNFASVTASGDANSISLLGWSAKQFREMAILSGCDYLPSIPGVGLKTAYTMLRRWKTPEQVVRAIGFEGKKSVPKGYMKNFRLADKCFLHQRVYHPGLERLVHLNDLPDDEDWDDVVDAFVGSDIDPSLAKAIAMGDRDPVTRVAMEDMNPGFAPRSRILQELPVATKQANRSPKGKGKARGQPAVEGILSFFGPNAKIPPTPKSPSIIRPKITPGTMVAGKDSGKRTLTEVQDRDMAARKKKRMTSPTKPTKLSHTASRFFGTSGMTGMKRDGQRATLFQHDSETPVAGSSRLNEKENEHIVIDDSEEGEGGSLIAQGHSDIDFDVEEVEVEQEDGYLSPTPSCSREIQDLSSPPRPRTAPLSRRTSLDALDFGAEAVSSPPRSHSRTCYAIPPTGRSRGKVLVESTPEIERSGTLGTFNMKDSFGDEVNSEIDGSGDETTSSPTPSPLTPDQLAEVDRDLTASIAVVESEEDLDESDEENEDKSLARRSAAVAAGWRSVWSYDSSGTGQGSSVFLRRSETNVTPVGRHKFGAQTQRRTLSRGNPYHQSIDGSSKAVSCNDGSSRRALKGRRSLTFIEETKTVKTQSTGSLELQPATMGHPEKDSHAKSRLESFRFVL